MPIKGVQRGEKVDPPPELFWGTVLPPKKSRDFVYFRNLFRYEIIHKSTILKSYDFERCMVILYFSDKILGGGIKFRLYLRLR